MRTLSPDHPVGAFTLFCNCDSGILYNLSLLRVCQSDGGCVATLVVKGDGIVHILGIAGQREGCFLLTIQTLFVLCIGDSCILWVDT